MTVRDIHHVQRDDQRNVEIEQLGCQIQPASKTRCIDDIDDDIVGLALWVWDHVPGFNDAARLIQTLFKLAKAIIDRRESRPSTQTISLPTIGSTPVLFTSVTRVVSHASTSLTTGAPNS